MSKVKLPVDNKNMTKQDFWLQTHAPEALQTHWMKKKYRWDLFHVIYSLHSIPLHVTIYFLRKNTQYK